MKMTVTPLELTTRHEFRIARGGRKNWEHLVVRLEHDGLVGLGEVAATAYYGENAATAAAALETWRPLLPADPWDAEGFERRAHAVLAGNYAAWNALDTALWDLRGQLAGVPLWKLWGLDREAMPVSSFTLGLADWETMERKLAEATRYPVLKIKVGGADDVSVLTRIRERTAQRIRVDANAGWSRAQALALLRGAALVRRPPAAGSGWVDLALLSYPALLLVVMSASKHQGGICFLLPAFPFVMLWVGRVWDDARRAFGRVGLAVCLLLLASGATETLARHPHHLMFVNAWVGGPINGPRYLVHRLDWGQDKRRLGEWLRAHDVSRVYYARYGGRPAQ